MPVARLPARIPWYFNAVLPLGLANHAAGFRRWIFMGLLMLPVAGVAARDDPAPISEFFAVKQESGGVGVYRHQRTDIYARLPGGKHDYIGTSQDGPPGGVGFLGESVKSLRAVTMAMSEDGRALVFRHWAMKAPRKSRLEAGIYQYVYGQGLKRLFSEHEIAGLSYHAWHKPFPHGMLPVRFTTGPMSRNVLWGLRTDGERFPLALHQASPLLWAAFEGRTDECLALIDAGADIDATSYWGFTALDLAIILDHPDTAIVLLARGADPEAGIYPAFNRAVMLGRMAVVRAMLARGVDVNGVDEHGYTPLHLAVFVGSRLVGEVQTFFPGTETPRSLLDRGFTTELVGLLLDHGASPDIPDNYGNTPRQVIHPYAPDSVTALLDQ